MTEFFAAVGILASAVALSATLYAIFEVARAVDARQKHEDRIQDLEGRVDELGRSAFRVPDAVPTINPYFSGPGFGDYRGSPCQGSCCVKKKRKTA